MSFLLNCCSCDCCFIDDASTESMEDSPKALPREALQMANDPRLSPRNTIDTADNNEAVKLEGVVVVPADAEPVEKVAAAYFAIQPDAQNIAVIELQTQPRQPAFELVPWTPELEQLEQLFISNN